MQYSDTTNKNGWVQRFEQKARLPDGTVTGTLAKQVASIFNRAIEKRMSMMLQYNDAVRWDDPNHTDAPIAYTNLVTSQSDYKFTKDANGLWILNINKIRILQGASETQYVELERMTLDDPRVAEAMSPSSGITGIPSAFVELGGRIYLDIAPNYNATNGMELFFGREHSSVASTDTTKEVGVPTIFHDLIISDAVYEYTWTHRPDEGNTLTILKDEIQTEEKKLRDFIDAQHPTRIRMTMSKRSGR